MKILKTLTIATMTLSLGAQTKAIIQQVGPIIGSSPPVVPYKPPRSKIPPIQPCPDFQANPEKDVIYKVAEGITRPRPTRVVSVRITEQGKEAYLHNQFKDPNEVVSSVSVIVDTQGKPESPCLVRAAGFDLDQQAAEAALQYRFNPALKDGMPVAMRIQILVNFQTH